MLLLSQQVCVSPKITTCVVVPHLFLYYTCCSPCTRTIYEAPAGVTPTLLHFTSFCSLKDCITALCSCTHAFPHQSPCNVMLIHIDQYTSNTLTGATPGDAPAATVAPAATAAPTTKAPAQAPGDAAPATAGAELSTRNFLCRTLFADRSLRNVLYRSLFLFIMSRGTVHTTSVMIELHYTLFDNNTATHTNVHTQVQAAAVVHTQHLQQHPPWWLLHCSKHQYCQHQ
jgi:hypothetical protein